ncbi:SDR family NAD(P)-dependent oxidoreductase [Spirosoma linguale]|uniref:Short-chain dehydrogenase/reductase SDR n=1 Tax=Spirosoma linguale (strain ATCC 33905 / DSM 74 / LMG 10896 / Claus 1) TaxID=504472 RepID=D2QKM1_SPILD|nr:short-chain dehydrogenase/reductase SDR [Spirosoma linguale DSM 74]
MENTTGKTVLITGATSGIGRELTNLFAKDGYNLVLVARSGDSLRLIANEYEQQFGIKATTITQDLADPKAADAIYEQTQQQGITVDILVNDAGMGEYGKFATETNLQKELDIVQINAVSLMHLTKLYLKDMVARNEGKILMLGSEVSVSPNPMMAVYGATKAFIKSFSEAIRNELIDTNITVTVLMPGATNTDFFNKAGAAHVKGADPSKTADPADVAKEGYEALMKGKDHVVAGWKNKAKVAMAHILPDPMVAANARKDMMPKDESDDQKSQLTSLAMGIGVAAGVIAGLYLAYRRSTPVEQAVYRYKAGKALSSAKKSSKYVGNSIKESARKAQETLEDALA